jgi:hypothetical protein
VQAPGLPFADVIDDEQVEQTLRQENVQRIDCVYTALVTLRMLLSQVMDVDPSLRQAVSRLLAERAAVGRAEISANTGAYSQARQRLPEAVLRRLARRVGDELLLQAPVRWLWHGRDVKIVDGSTVSMPDTSGSWSATTTTAETWAGKWQSKSLRPCRGILSKVKAAHRPNGHRFRQKEIGTPHGPFTTAPVWLASRPGV